MRHILAKWILFRVWGWKIEGAFPAELSKYILVVAPHTSWVDFLMGILIREVTGIKAGYIGKATLFRPPFGWFFRATGGYPVDRSKNNNFVDAAVAMIREREQFIVAIAPEGTRKKVSQLKTGFYYIALGANIPLVLTKLDFKNKIVGIAEPFYPSGNKEADFEKIVAFFRGVEGYHPEKSIYF